MKDVINLGEKRIKTMAATRRIRFFTLFLQLAVLGSVLTIGNLALSEVKRLKGQTVYVPAYSHIYHGDRATPFYLTVTLSIRNTDPAHPITIVSGDYFDTDGKLLKRYLDGEIRLASMASTHYVVKESDKGGGSGANFIVKWKSDAKVTEPIIETVMISTATQQGISFTSRGQAIEEHYD
jgi:hypothetical protein